MHQIDGKTVWETNRNGEQVIDNHSPDVYILKRMLAKLVSYIVPEWLLLRACMRHWQPESVISSELLNSQLVIASDLSPELVPFA